MSPIAGLAGLKAQALRPLARSRIGLGASFTLLFAAAIVAISACASSEEGEAAEPTTLPTINVFTTPTPRPNEDEIRILLGADIILPGPGFFIQFPDDWTSDTDDPSGFDVVLRAPQPDRDATGQAYPAISVGTDVPEGYDGLPGRQFLDKTLDDGLPLLQGTLNGLRMIRAQVERLPTGDSVLFEYSYNSTVAGRLHSVQYVVPGDTRVFLITLTSLESAWDRYARTFNVAMATFSILAGK